MTRMAWRFASERTYDVQTLDRDDTDDHIMLSCYEAPEAGQEPALAFMIGVNDYDEARALGEAWVIHGAAEVVRLVKDAGFAGIELDPRFPMH